jgi:hypothetical protein
VDPIVVAPASRAAHELHLPWGAPRDPRVGAIGAILD